MYIFGVQLPHHIPECKQRTWPMKVHSKTLLQCLLACLLTHRHLYCSAVSVSTFWAMGMTLLRCWLLSFCDQHAVTDRGQSKWQRREKEVGSKIEWLTSVLLQRKVIVEVPAISNTCLHLACFVWAKAVDETYLRNVCVRCQCKVPALQYMLLVCFKKPLESWI